MADRKIEHITDDTIAIAYILRELPIYEHFKLHQHLGVCEDCSRKVEEIRQWYARFQARLTLAGARKRERFDVLVARLVKNELQIINQIQEIIEDSPTRFSILVQYDAGGNRQMSFRGRLTEELNAHPLDDFINPTASMNGNGTIGIVNAKLLNLSQIREATSAPLIIIGSSRELNTSFAEPILEIPIKWKKDILTVQLPDEASAIWQRQAEQVCDRLGGITNPREAILAVLDHGASDEVMPLSWLERMGYLKSNPHPLIEELFEFREVITPINPYLGKIANWEEAQYLTATDGEVARIILERMGRWNGRARTDYYKNLINAVITKETEPESEDAKLMCRLLHALYLRGWRSALYYVLSNTQETMNPLLNKLLEEAEDARYLMAWGKVYAKGGDSDKAIKFLEAAEKVAEEKDQQSLPYILRVRAGLSLERSDVREAIRDLEQARELQPQNLTILTALAAAYARLPHQRDRALELADEAKALKPDSPYPYQIAGYARMRFGQETSQRRYFAEAAEEFNQALEKDPNSVPTLTAWAEMAMERGHLRPQIDEYNDEPIFSAEKLLEQALDIEPLNVPTLVSLGRLHTELKEYSKAKSYLRQALRQLPQNVQALTALAHLYTQQGDFERAKETLERAEGVYDENAYIVAEQGRMLIEQGKTDEAIDILEKRLEREEGLNKVVLLNLLVKVYCEKRDFVVAAETFIEARRLQPRNPQTYNNWVECLLKIDSRDEIEKIVEEIKAQKRWNTHPKIVADSALGLDAHNSYTLRICGVVEKFFGDEKKGEELLKLSCELGLMLPVD